MAKREGWGARARCLRFFKLFTWAGGNPGFVIAAPNPTTFFFTDLHTKQIFNCGWKYVFVGLVACYLFFVLAFFVFYLFFWLFFALALHS